MKTFEIGTGTTLTTVDLTLSPAEVVAQLKATDNMEMLEALKDHEALSDAQRTAFTDCYEATDAVDQVPSAASILEAAEALIEWAKPEDVIVRLDIDRKELFVKNPQGSSEVNMAKAKPTLVKLLRSSKQESGDIYLAFEAPDGSLIETNFSPNFFKKLKEKRTLAKLFPVSNYTDGLIPEVEESDAPLYHKVLLENRVGFENPQIPATTYRIYKPKAGASKARKEAWATAKAEVESLFGADASEYIGVNSAGTYIMMKHQVTAFGDVSRIITRVQETEFTAIKKVYDDQFAKDIDSEREGDRHLNNMSKAFALADMIQMDAKKHGKEISRDKAVGMAMNKIDGKGFEIKF
jgi:hypothetical protein